MRAPRLVAILAAAVTLAACNSDSSSGKSAAAAPPAHAARSGGHDWTRFGYDAARTSRSPRGISAGKVKGLTEHRVDIDGTVDSSPIYIDGKPDLLVMTTTYGKTLALNAVSGAKVWEFTPSSYSGVAGSAQITTATPVLDPGRRFVFAASPDGRIHKLRAGSGHEVTSGRWPASVTRDATHEKIASALNVSGKNVLVTTGGYIGDAPPYQGKVVAIKRSSGRVAHVFNSLCADRRRIIEPSSCRGSDSAIWGRAGAVVAPGSHKIYATSSNGPFDGSTNWADSVLELSPGVGKLLRHYTPANQRQLEATDADLGSTSPALLAHHHLLQGGKDGKLRLLNLRTSLHGVHGAAGKKLGGEVQTLPLPGGAGQLFTAPAVLHKTVAFVATNDGSAAYRLKHGRLKTLWSHGTAGTSPVVAGGLVWIYDPGGGLDVYRPLTGKLVHHFDTPSGHWNSPIVMAGRVYVPMGDANDHDTSGSISIFR